MLTASVLLVKSPASLPSSLSVLVAQAQGGDTYAFEQLYRRLVGRVYAVCLRLLQNPSRAEEATQEAFIRAWERLGSFEASGAFEGWMVRLAVNVTLGMLRSQRRREARVQPAEDDWLMQAPAFQPPAGLALDLEAAIARLPERARLVLVLHDIEGYKHLEIADLLGIAAGTSKAHLHHARRFLRNALSA